MHFFPLAQANEYTFKHITSANGLPQNYVRSVIQDSRGFMWFTTFDGIVRYDGYSFKTYRRYDNGLDTGLMLYVTEDAAGNLWVGTEMGLYCYDIDTDQFTRISSYFPKDFGGEFDSDYNITEWLTQYSEEKDVTYVRGFLGRMLFSGEDGVKKLKVLSGGEKVRCLLSKMMISGANVLLLDEPTNHLDMESITALNNGLIKFPGVLLFTSRDHQIVQTTANRIMEIVPGGQLIDKITTYDEYLESDEMARKRQTYTVSTEEDD